MFTARHVPNGGIATPHHLASAAGLQVLMTGGNAVDAAVAANLVLAVVTPYHCGLGGDVLAMIDSGDAQPVVGLASIGRAPLGATPAQIRAAVDGDVAGAADSLPGTDGMPVVGALPVTVPGAIAGWFALLERFGSRSFGELATAAIGLASSGFEVSPHAAAQVDGVRARLDGQPGWSAHFGQMRAGRRFVQADLARTLRLLAEDGPDAFYDGPLGARTVEILQAHGSTMDAHDLQVHAVEAPGPISGRFRDVEVWELPPPTQGVTALGALGMLDALGPAATDPAVALHRQVEVIRAALADRGAYLGDPATMTVKANDLLAPDRLARLAAGVDDARAAPWPPARSAPGGTASLCAVDAEGRGISLIQSTFMTFGSGMVVPGTGVVLHNRGAYFRLGGDHPTTIGPGRRPLHTLIPAVARRDGRPWLVFGTMGGDAQPQIHLQVLARLLDEGMELQETLAAPRFVVDPAAGSVRVEGRMTPVLVDGLRSRGHDVGLLAAYDHLAGHAQAIVHTPAGYALASDPRTEGAAVGW